MQWPCLKSSHLILHNLHFHIYSNYNLPPLQSYPQMVCTQLTISQTLLFHSSTHHCWHCTSSATRPATGKKLLTHLWQVQWSIIEATTVFSSLRVLSTWQELCLQMLCNNILQLHCETFQNQQSGMRKQGSNVCTGTGYSEVTAQHWNSSSYLAVVGTIQQDISCCKISVDKPFLGEVDHTCNYLAAEFQKFPRTHCLQCPGEYAGNRRVVYKTLPQWLYDTLYIKNYTIILLMHLIKCKQHKDTVYAY